MPLILSRHQAQNPGTRVLLCFLTCPVAILGKRFGETRLQTGLSSSRFISDLEAQSAAGGTDNLKLQLNCLSIFLSRPKSGLSSIQVQSICSSAVGGNVWHCPHLPPPPRIQQRIPSRSYVASHRARLTSWHQSQVYSQFSALRHNTGNEVSNALCSNNRRLLNTTI